MTAWDDLLKRCDRMIVLDSAIPRAWRSQMVELARALKAVEEELSDAHRLYGGAGMIPRAINNIRAAIERRLKEPK